MTARIPLLVAWAFVFAVSLNPSAHADALRVNGLCELNNCNNVPITPANTSSSTDFDFTYLFANSDSYQVQGTIFQGQFTSGAEYYNEIGLLNFVITYLGNGTNRNSGNDVLSSELLGSYPFEGAGSGTFSSELFGVFGPGLGLASSASANFSVDGLSVSKLGPVSPPPGSFDISNSGPTRQLAGNQTLDYDYVLTFGQGSTPGSSIELYPTTPPPTGPPNTSPVPEPSSLALLGTGIVGLAGTLRRRLLTS